MYIYIIVHDQCFSRCVGTGIYGAGHAVQQRTEFADKLGKKH